MMSSKGISKFVEELINSPLPISIFWMSLSIILAKDVVHINKSLLIDI